MKSHHRRGTIEIFAAPHATCPICLKFAVCLLPPILASRQTDGTNAVCHPSHGGCNHGFEVGAASAQDDAAANAFDDGGEA